MLKIPLTKTAPLLIAALSLIVLIETLTPTHAEVCKSQMTETQAKTSVEKFQQRMKIALVRGDIASMTDLYNNTLLENCSDNELPRLCSFDCYTQLGQYFLFEASDIRYYTNKSGVGTPLLLPENLAKNIDKHIAFLEKGQKLLDFQGSFREFIKKSSDFKYYQAQLYMALADIWYQAQSETRIRGLANLIGAQQTDNQNNAGAYYQRARLIVAETLMAMPERADFILLQSELNTRLQSLKKGYLFLNIDPQEYSIFDVPKLQAEINKIAQQVEHIEDKIVGLSTSWLKAKGTQQAQKIDDARKDKELSTTASAYKIAMLEDMSKDYANEVSSAQAELKKQQALEQSTTFELEQRKNELQFQLASKLTELQHRKKLIVSKTEMDVLKVKQDDLKTRIADLRWLMNWQVAKTNLQLQISAYHAQLTQYERELTKNEGKKKALTHSIQSNNLRIQMAENRIAESQAQINRIKKERSAIFKQKRALLKESICQLEKELAFFGVQPTHKFSAENGDACPSVKPSYTQTDYLKQATKTRQMLLQQKIDSVQQLLVCVTGVETIPDSIKPLIDLSVKCPNNLKLKKRQIEFAKKIALKEQKRADAQLAKMRTHITKLQRHIEKVLKLLKTIKDIKQKYEQIVTAAQKAYEIASALPNIIAGIGAGTEFDPSKIAKAAYEGAKNALDRVLKWAESEGSLDEKALQLTAALEKLKGQMTLKKVEADIRQSQVLRTVQEIYGKGMQQAHDIQELLLQKQEIVQDAQFEKIRLKANIAATQSEHRKRLLEWGLAGQRNDQLQFAIATQKREIEKQRLQIEIIKHQTQELETQLSVLERDIQSIETLKAYSTASIEKIQQLASDLSGLEQEVSAQEAALKRLNKEELQKIIAVEGIELGYVEAVIKQEKSQTDQLKQTIDQLISIEQQQTQLSLEETQLTQDMLAYQKDISRQIQAEREILMNNLQESKGAGAKKDKLFIATQADIATLLKGVPTLIHNKRRLMESANRYLNLLRNRIEAMISVAENTQFSSEISYVKTHDDLIALQKLIADQALWSNAQVITEMSNISVPRGSGLANALAQQRKAIFEISPAARDNQAAGGYFSLWSNNFDPDEHGTNQNLMLIDFHVGIDFPDEPTCDFIRRPVRITHNGSGFVFKEMSANDSTLSPVFLSTPARSTKRSYISLNNDQNLVNQLGNFWAQRHYLYNFLEDETPPDDTGAAMPLMGLPVIGSYELVLPNPPAGCTYEGAEFRFYLVYAKSMR